MWARLYAGTTATLMPGASFRAPWNVFTSPFFSATAPETFSAAAALAATMVLSVRMGLIAPGSRWSWCSCVMRMRSALGSEA